MNKYLCKILTVMGNARPLIHKAQRKLERKNGPSTQQSATVTPHRDSDTPMASIRLMSVQNTCTAAVLPTTNVASIHDESSSSTSSGNTVGKFPVTALP